MALTIYISSINVVETPFNPPINLVLSGCPMIQREKHTAIISVYTKDGKPLQEPMSSFITGQTTAEATPTGLCAKAFIFDKDGGPKFTLAAEGSTFTLRITVYRKQWMWRRLTFDQPTEMLSCITGNITCIPSIH